MVRGFLFGLTVAATIGPIALLIINTSLRFGLAAGVRSAFGAATADFAYAIVAALAGSVAVGAVAEAENQIRLAASALLMAMGGWLVFSALRARGRVRAAATAETARAYLTTFGLTIVNPLTLLAFAAFIAQGAGEAGPWGAAATAVGIFAGSLAVQLALAVGGAWARKLAATGPALFALNLLSGAGVFAFGAVGLLPRM
jgi:threonine/homoserine/homoserine lactone efflux protein